MNSGFFVPHFFEYIGLAALIASLLHVVVWRAKLRVAKAEEELVEAIVACEKYLDKKEKDGENEKKAFKIFLRRCVCVNRI